ncbi:MAG TPA: CHASE2 domain-containing protein [Rhodocyclaceae bacterium]|nr:CHASE2 domain-containing protein [Rhodocyclaceae bacterium]
MSAAAGRLRPLSRSLLLWGLLALPLALALLAPLSPLYARVESWLLDADQRLLAREQYFDNTVVVEIDEESLAELQPYFGKWPYDRSTYALLLDYLGEMQARAVFFDILFADGRAGDAEFRSALTRNSQAILASSALRQPVAHESDNTLPPRLAWLRAGTAPPPAIHWPSLALPLPLLTGPDPLPRVGVITFNYDDDGVLRRLPLLHDIGGNLLPSAILAALRPEGASIGVAGDAGHLRVGEASWPVDRQGSVGLIYPANANSVLTMPLSRLAKAALGHPDTVLEKDFFRGKTVFIGSTTLFADHVNTPYGIMNGIHVLAIAFATLSHGLFLAPASTPWNLLLLLIAMAAPAMVAIAQWRRRTLRAHWAPVITGASALILYGLHMALLAGHQPTWLATPLLAMLTGGILSTALLQRQARLHAQAAADNATARVAQQQEVVAMVSHELKTPLATIDLTLQNLSMVGDLPPPVVARHQKLRRASRRLQALIQHHLAEDRLRQGNDLRTDIFDLAPMIEEIAEAAEYSELTVDMIDANCMTVKGDKEMLRVALSNLVGNAIKYSPDGGSIHIVANTDGDRLRIQVMDHGIGIDADSLPHIFDPYFRADGVRQPGSGLGLHLVQQIVERHGGTISADSQAGAGSIFTVMLPLTKA